MSNSSLFGWKTWYNIWTLFLLLLLAHRIKFQVQRAFAKQVELSTCKCYQVFAFSFLVLGANSCSMDCELRPQQTCETTIGGYKIEESSQGPIYIPSLLDLEILHKYINHNSTNGFIWHSRIQIPYWLNYLPSFFVDYGGLNKVMMFGLTYSTTCQLR